MPHTGSLLFQHTAGSRHHEPHALASIDRVISAHTWNVFMCVDGCMCGERNRQTDREREGVCVCCGWLELLGPLKASAGEEGG